MALRIPPVVWPLAIIAGAAGAAALLVRRRETAGVVIPASVPVAPAIYSQQPKQISTGITDLVALMKSAADDWPASSAWIGSIIAFPVDQSRLNSLVTTVQIAKAEREQYGVPDSLEGTFSTFRGNVSFGRIGQNFALLAVG